MRGSEQKPGSILPLDAHHHLLSLRCLTGRPFAGGPAGFPTALHSSLSFSFVSVTFCICLSSLLCCFPLLSSILVLLSSHLLPFSYPYISVFSFFILQFGHRGDNNPFAWMFIYRYVYFLGLLMQFQRQSCESTHLMISETVFIQWFNHSLVHFYHSGETSWV